jgi:hypothetical protein
MGCAEGVVDDQRNRVLVGDVGESFEIRCHQRGVGDGFDVDVGGVVVDRVAVGVVVECWHRPGLDPAARRERREVAAGAAVHVVAGDDVVAVLGQHGRQ